MFPPLLVGAVVSGVATVGTLIQHYRQQLGPMTLAEVRALTRTPVTPIGEAREGFVKLVGTVGCDTPERSLHGDTLVAAREVHHYAFDGRGARARKVLTRVERTTALFWIEDDTGRIVLDPARTRVDFELEGTDVESMVEEHRLRVGERVAVLGRVRRDVTLSHHPHRQLAVQSDKGLHFVDPPVVTWRTEPEVYPRLLPSAGGVALSLGSVGLAVLGSILRV